MSAILYYFRKKSIKFYASLYVRNMKFCFMRHEYHKTENLSTVPSPSIDCVLTSISKLSVTNCSLRSSAVEAGQLGLWVLAVILQSSCKA